MHLFKQLYLMKDNKQFNGFYYFILFTISSIIIILMIRRG
jgi:hypothetical protein